LASDLGLEIKTSKNQQGYIADFGGIELDTFLMEAKLPESKKLKAIQLLQDCGSKTSISLEQLRSLTGFLSFMCKVIPLGKVVSPEAVQPAY
jgi:hypothetical protein